MSRNDTTSDRQDDLSPAEQRRLERYELDLAYLREIRQRLKEGKS
jgi:hypothetical protein